MITFACRGCGKTFMVPDEFAGRSAKCKQCGGPVMVPALRGREGVGAGTPEPARVEAAALADPSISVDAVAPPAAPAAVAPVVAPAVAPPVVALPVAAQTAASPPALAAAAAVSKKLPMRLRRLHADAEEITRVFASSPIVRILETTGDPAELYRIEYAVRGLAPGPGGKPVPKEKHLAQVQLTSEYPRSSPTCKMLTPIFHPNIDPAGICVGDHWTAGERLSDLIVRIGEMIAYQAYNIRSPLDAEAAMWADLHQSELPIDSRDLHPHVD